MKSLLRLPTALMMFTCTVVVSASAKDLGQNRESSSAIRAVLAAQQTTWNNGDIDGFMNGYQKSPDTVFVSGDTLTRGWQTVRDRYRAKYATAAKMGRLRFSEIDIRFLAPHLAVAQGRWELTRAQDHPHGRFTLLFRLTNGEWRIILDHTSSA